MSFKKICKQKLKSLPVADEVTEFLEVMLAEDRFVEVRTWEAFEKQLSKMGASKEAISLSRGLSAEWKEYISNKRGEPWGNV